MTAKKTTARKAPAKRATKAKGEIQLPEPQVPAKVDASVERATRWATELHITDQATLASATSMAATIKEDYDTAEAARDSLVRPLNNHVKFINDTFRPRTTGLKAALDAVKAKIRGYAAEQEERAEEERQRMQAEADARAAAEALVTGDDVQAPEVVIETRVSAHTDRGSASIAKRWTYEVTDLQSLCAAIGRGELPTSLVEPAKGKLRELVNDEQERAKQLARQAAAGPTSPALGLRFFQETDVSVRRA